MLVLNLEKTIQNKRLVFKRTKIEILLDIIPFVLIISVLGTISAGITYLLLTTNEIENSYWLFVIATFLFLSWFVLGLVNMGRLISVNGINKSDVIDWVNRKSADGTFKKINNQQRFGYIEMIDSSWSKGAFFYNHYLFFNNDEIYITSTAFGKSNNLSPFHYFTNRRNMNKLKNELTLLK